MSNKVVGLIVFQVSCETLDILVCYEIWEVPSLWDIIHLRESKILSLLSHLWVISMINYDSIFYFFHLIIEVFHWIHKLYKFGIRWVAYWLAFASIWVTLWCASWHRHMYVISIFFHSTFLLKSFIWENFIMRLLSPWSRCC